MDPDALSQIDQFSGCDDASAFAKVHLTLDVQGRQEGRDVNVAIRPPTLQGEYAVRLIYADALGVGGEMPVRMLVDECTPDHCSTRRVTAVINATVVGSKGNGIDDDGDRFIDNDEEEGRTFRRRDSPAFPEDTTLYGTVSDDKQFIHLQGVAHQLPDLAFATDISSGGIANIFAGASRELLLEGQRTGPEAFGGVFVERYIGLPNRTPLRGRPTTATEQVLEGRFVLSRVRLPECVARDAESTRSVPLGVLCRPDADETKTGCPLRCVSRPGVSNFASAGLACHSSADCSSAGECHAFPCAVQIMKSQPAFDGPLGLRPYYGSAMHPPDAPVLAELVGTDYSAVAIGDVRVDFQDPPCGSYTLRLKGFGCQDTVVANYHPCGCGGVAPPCNDNRDIRLQCNPRQLLSPVPFIGSYTSQMTTHRVRITGDFTLSAPRALKVQTVFGLATVGQGVAGQLVVGGTGIDTKPTSFLVSLGVRVVQTGLLAFK
jgi:hypothetical protein